MRFMKNTGWAKKWTVFRSL